jgi:hypothetical protein
MGMDEPEEDPTELKTTRDETRSGPPKFLNEKKKLIAIANKELSLKRKVAEKMEDWRKAMDSFAEGLKVLTTTLNSGFKWLVVC